MIRCAIIPLKIPGVSRPISLYQSLSLGLAIPRLASQSARNEKGRRLGPWPSQTAPSRGVRLSNPADAPVRVWQWWGRLMGCVAEMFVAQWQSTCSVWLIAVAGPERTLAQSGRLLQFLS